VKYQRNANFATNQLLDLSGVTVANSIDPFFFHISWPEDKLAERKLYALERERLEIKGLRYEKLEIDELKLDLGDSNGAEDCGIDRVLARLGHQMERLGKRLLISASNEEHHKH
jgi:hypothetical protein